MVSRVVEGEAELDPGVGVVAGIARERWGVAEDAIEHRKDLGAPGRRGLAKDEDAGLNRYLRSSPCPGLSRQRCV